MVKTKKQDKSVKKINLLELNVSNIELPLKYDTGSVLEVNLIHTFEYVPAKQRIPLMEEIWRILEDGGKLNIIVCYWTSPRAIQDPSLEWPPICEQSFLYFNKGWRAQNLLSSIRCDFDFSYGYQVEADTAGRNAETQSFWIKHYANAVNDLQLVLVKRP